MTKQYMNVFCLLLFICPSAAAEKGVMSSGMHVMFGGRYDNMRMCVASPAGAKGGIIADIMFDARYYVRDDIAVVLNLPVMRPILFGLAFRMLQFEPQVAIESYRNINDKTDAVLSPGIGVSFHYGPDYKSDNKNPGAAFFAAGPFISGLCGVGFGGSAGKRKIIGIRAFYVPLFSKDHGVGTVIGGSIEGHFSFQ